MRAKTAIVPRAAPKVKNTPDDRVFVTKRGTKVRFAVNTKWGAGEMAIRVSDGRAMWSIKREDVTPFTSGPNHFTDANS